MKVSAKVWTYEDTELLQQDLNIIYKWADENLKEALTEHTIYVVQLSKIETGLLLRTFETREAPPLLAMLNSQI